MDTGHIASETRRLLIGTLHGAVEGNVAIGPQVRTLDYLNRVTTRFMPLAEAKSINPFPALQGDDACVNLSKVLWVTEIEEMRPVGLAKVRPQLNRCAVRFCFPGCEALGFLHTPSQGHPLARLNQERGAFLALTSVSLIGADTEMTIEFMAVNSNHLISAEIVAQEDATFEGASIFEEAGW